MKYTTKTTSNMEAKELRLGNLFIEKGSQFVKTIEATTFVEIESGYIIPQPIPITEEWLLKFGFKIDNECNEFELSTSIAEFIIGKTELGNWFCYQIKMDGSLCFKDVHQLQNLYFSLTGQELTFKD